MYWLMSAKVTPASTTSKFEDLELILIKSSPYVVRFLCPIKS